MPPTTSGWVEYGEHALNITQGHRYRKITANWGVPNWPIGVYGADILRVYYTFPGLQNSAPAILQPVLSYGYNGDYGGTYWAIASWYCGNLICFHGPVYEVDVGRVLFGSVEASSCAGTKCTWTITTRVVATGVQSVLTLSTVDDFHRAVGGAVEVYEVNDCNQYPPNGVFYSSVALFNQNMSQVSPSWEELVLPVTPVCDFEVNTTPTTVSLVHYPTPVLNTLTTNPSPPVQYQPATYTMTGSGFDPATVEAKILGDSSVSSCPSPGCFIRNDQFTTKTGTLLEAPNVAFSIPGPYTLWVHNGAGGYTQGIHYRIRSFY